LEVPEPVAFTLVMVTALMNTLLRALIAGSTSQHDPLEYIVAWVSLEIVRSVGKKERARVEGVKQVAEAHH